MKLRLLGRQHEAQGLTAGGCRGGSQVQEAEASRPEGESWHLVSILGIQGIFEKPGRTLGCSVALCSAVVGSARALGDHHRGQLGAEAARTFLSYHSQLRCLREALLTRRRRPKGHLGTDSFGRHAQRDFQMAANIS